MASNGNFGLLPRYNLAIICADSRVIQPCLKVILPDWDYHVAYPGGALAFLPAFCDNYCSHWRDLRATFNLPKLLGKPPASTIIVIDHMDCGAYRLVAEHGGNEASDEGLHHLANMRALVTDLLNDPFLRAKDLRRVDHILIDAAHTSFEFIDAESTVALVLTDAHRYDHGRAFFIDQARTA